MKKVNQLLNLKSFKLNKLALKYFSGGHHHVTGKIDEHRHFVPLDAFTKSSGLFAVSGLPADHIDEHSHHKVIEHGPTAYLQANPFDLIDKPTKLADVPFEENPYAHEDVYGYTLGDDVSALFE